MKTGKIMYTFLLLVFVTGLSIYTYYVGIPETNKPIKKKLEQNEKLGFAEEEEQEAEEKYEGEWKTILFWTSWFGSDWSGSFGHKSPHDLRKAGCPSWQCHFTHNRSEINAADAVVFSSYMYHATDLPQNRTPDQRWVWVEVEAPREGQARACMNSLINANKYHNYLNWTMTYHTNSDVVAFYGHFISKGQKSMPVRPHLMSQHPVAMKKYLNSREKNATLKDTMGPSWLLFVIRPKLVAWMAGHCGTLSRREEYIRELEKYIPVDKYGRCGTLKCLPIFPRHSCYEKNVGLNYFFYLSFENDLCDEYITEKLYYAIYYNLVPVVWGGSDYDRFLPPGSYINAKHYHPKDLAELLKKLQADPIAYGRYHVWRAFFDVSVVGSFCELCHKLHTDTSHKMYDEKFDFNKWRKDNNRCFPLPTKLFLDPKYPNAWKAVIDPHSHAMMDNNSTSNSL